MLPLSHTDWVIMARFYSALHYVDAVLASTPGIPGGYHPKSHRKREFLITHSTILKPLAKSYMHLHQRCDDVRYDLMNIPPSDIEPKFEDVKKRTRALLGQP